MVAWAASKRAAVEQIPRATGPTSVHSDGGDANRVLVFGSGLAVGWGATSHTDALPGALARALSDLTDVGTDVDVITDPWLLVRDARAALAGKKLWRFDVIVVALGFADALKHTSVRTWGRDMSALLTWISGQAKTGTRIVVLGNESIGSLAPFEGANMARADARLESFDRESARLAGKASAVRFVSLESGSADYTAAGERLADAMIDDLYAARSESDGSTRGPAGQHPDERERERQAGVEASGILDTPHEDRFDRIVTMARQLYGTSGAAFAVVDNDRVWHKSRSEGVPAEVPRNQSFCSTTILLRGPHVVPDMLVEAAPADTSAADEVGVRFYAGYPVEDSTGEQIGALCIFDEKPRTDSVFDESMLRQLALLIQAELSVEALSS